MAKRDWQQYLSSAASALNRAEKDVNKAVQALMLEKGFTKKQVLLFGATFSTGNETVIHFNYECADSDLDITNAAEMTKDEIIANLSRWASKETIKLLKGEQNGTDD